MRNSGLVVARFKFVFGKMITKCSILVRRVLVPDPFLFMDSWLNPDLVIGNPDPRLCTAGMSYLCHHGGVVLVHGVILGFR